MGRTRPAAPDPFAPSEIRARLERLREVLRRRRLDGLLVGSVAGVRYLSGFSGDSSMALVTRERQHLLTDFRFEEEAALSAPLFACRLRRRGLMEAAAALAGRLRLRRLGFEDHLLPAGGWRELAGRLAGRCRLAATRGLVEELRAVKSPAEVAAIRAAVGAAERGLRLARRAFRPGASELSAAAELRRAMVARCGAQDQAFETIVAEGPRGSLPHARPTDRAIGGQSLLMVDWGARCRFYHSDLTRVLAAGRIPRAWAKLVRLVRAAQLAALERVRAGASLAAVDRAARAVIARAGYGARFGHGLGHGLGLEVHEEPRVWARAAGRLEAGMVFTVEPGVYLPGRFGVRLEDDVLVTETGCEVLSSFAHDPRWRGE